MRLISRAFLALTLATTFASTAHAQISGIEGMTATVLQEHQSSFSGLALRARVHSTQLISNVEFLPSIEWWRNTSTVQPFGVQATRSDATVGVDARYVGEFRGFHPYAGLGLGMHFIHNEVSAPSLGLVHAEDSLIKGGPAFLGGANFPMGGKFENFIELKYHYIPTYSQLKINMGLTYKIE